MASYTLVPPAPSSSGVDLQSGDFTVAADSSTITGSLVITPAASDGDGAFSPATVTLTDAAKTATFKYTPTKPGARTITTTNSQSYVDPAGVAFTCLASSGSAQTVVKNVSGVDMTFSFLGPRGVRLAAGEEYAIQGDVHSSTVLRYRPRDYSDFLRALADGRLLIVSTPGVIVKDSQTGAVKQLKLTNGSLGTRNPSWGAYTDA